MLDSKSSSYSQFIDNLHGDAIESRKAFPDCTSKALPALTHDALRLIIFLETALKFPHKTEEKLSCLHSGRHLS